MTSIVSFSVFSVFSAKNTASESDQLLLASSQGLTTTPEQVITKHCIYFIQGFLAATQVIDPLIIKKQSKKSAEFYGFSSRPLRNWDQILSTRFLPFSCQDESETRIIKTISKQLSPKIDTAKMLRDWTFKILNAKYS